MPASNVCWGIELGAGAVKAIKLQREGDEVKVLAFADIPHKKVLSTPELDQMDATRVAMGQLISQHDGLRGASIAIAIPGHSAFARFAKLPPVEPKKIPDIVKFEAVQQIPFPIDQVEWDFQVFQSPDNPDVEVGIFAVTRDKIQDRLTMWNEVGVAPDYVTIGPVAAYNALAFDQNFNDKTPGTVILDVGTTSTDLVIAEPGRVWVRTFPIGGHQFTEALVTAFKLSYAKAEALKRQAEQSKHARHVLQALRPVFSDLTQDVQRSIGYYQSSHKDANLTRLIALGSTFNLPGLRKYLGQQLQMEVIRLEKFNRLTLDGAQAAEFEAATINMATAYGLALQGLGFKHGIMVNLVPKVIVREQVWRKKTKWFAAAAALSVVGGAVSFLRPVSEKYSNPTASKPPILQQTQGAIAKLKGQWTEVSKGFQTDFKASNVALLLERRDIHAALLNDIASVLKSANDKAMSEIKPEEQASKLGLAGAGQGFSFVSYRTNYAGVDGESAAGADKKPAPPKPAPAKPTPGAAGKPGEAPAEEVVLNGPRIKVELNVRTTRTDADKFVVQTVLTWLKENSIREGVPYGIDPKSLSYVLEKSVIAGRGEGAGEGAGGGSGGGDPSPPPTGRGRRGGGGTPPGGDRDGVPGGGGGGDAGGGHGGESLDQVAPLPAESSIGRPGEAVYNIRVHFDAVVRPAAGAAGAAEVKS